MTKYITYCVVLSNENTVFEIWEEQKYKSLRNLNGQKSRRPIGKWRYTGLSDRNENYPMQ